MLPTKSASLAFHLNDFLDTCHDSLFMKGVKCCAESSVGARPLAWDAPHWRLRHNIP